MLTDPIIHVGFRYPDRLRRGAAWDEDAVNAGVDGRRRQSASPAAEGVGRHGLRLVMTAAPRCNDAGAVVE